MSLTSTDTLLNQEDVDGYNNSAKIFLLGGDPKANPDKLDPHDPANTFILNSEDFVNLQKYVRACTALPSTEELFEAEYSKENLKQFFDEDDTLYDFMKIVLPRMHQRANEFQINTIEPMITLGGRIGNFAKDSGKYIETIVTSLMIMGEPGMVKGSLKFDAAKRKVDTLLDRLTTHAKEVEDKCGEMFAQLTKFKTDTENQDLKDIIEIDRRLKKIIPDEEAKKSKVQKIIDKAKFAVEGAKKVLEAEMEKAREAGRVKWYQFNEQYLLAQAKGENAIESITAASHQLDSLTDDIKGVKDTINNALLAVGKMQKTFGNLQTMFQDIKKKLDNVTSDVNDEFALDYELPMDDLKDAAQTWKRVHILSQIFQSTGLVLDGKDAPEQADNEKQD
ncbi:hypothetical protein FPCIR_11391 [Fusarium pseudocircinatum]|uniref:Uncharacterized protein n=1 Tax=Fusarium pseudocircinatum TaxID=56676 RepID=A0A8H5KSU9_9HYPO|nr:hypothetical protein FPCIR_11391 [Fusarium pseudocircinatum]